MPPQPAETGSLLTVTSRSRGPTFNLDAFSSKDFIVKDWIEKLSDEAGPRRRSGTINSQTAFDPKPLIRTFEAARAQLNHLSEDLESRENELSNAVRRAEAQHKQTASTLGGKLDQAIRNFNRLDATLNGISGDGEVDAGGGAALRIGERLEELERQSQRAQDAKFLLICWIEVSERGSLSQLEDLKRRPGADGGQVRCASIARQLLRISQRMEQDDGGYSNGQTNGVNGNSRRNGDTPGSKFNTRELIERFLEGLETDLLQQFDTHYRRNALEAMKECATALRDFNDGASVAGRYVNQHSFFIDRSQLITEEMGDAETWDRIADPDAEAPGVEPGLQALCDEVKITAQNESYTIKRGFPVPDEILNIFIQRLFQQSIQQRLEMVLEKAGSISSLSFLRALQSSRTYISSLVDDLKAHGLTEHPESATPGVSSNLDQQLDDLFVPYLAGSSYIEREKRNLDELYSSLLFKFTTYHSRRKKMPTTYLDRLGQRGAQLMQSARDAYMDRLDSTELPASQKEMLIRIAGLKDSDKEKDIEVTEEDGQLNVSHAKRMLRWLAECVGRSLELNGGNETPKDIQALLGVLLTQMGDIYIENALSAATDLASAQESIKTEPDLTYLPPLRTTIQILHLLQTTIQTMLLPLTSSNITLRRDIDKSSSATLSNLESKISSILHRTLDTSLAWVAKLLTNQKKNDFRPKDEELASAIEALQTPTCLSIFNFLSKVASLATETLDGANLSSFLSELASGLRSLLLEHFRKFSVSLTGGLIISKDVTRYSELVRKWPLQGTSFEAKGGMEVIVEVANLFVIGPEALRERLKGGGRSQEDVAELRKYVEKREDSNSVGVQAVLSSV